MRAHQWCVAVSKAFTCLPKQALGMLHDAYDTTCVHEHPGTSNQSKNLKMHKTWLVSPVWGGKANRAVMAAACASGVPFLPEAFESSGTTLHSFLTLHLAFLQFQSSQMSNELRNGVGIDDHSAAPETRVSSELSKLFQSD